MKDMKLKILKISKLTTLGTVIQQAETDNSPIY